MANLLLLLCFLVAAPCQALAGPAAPAPEVVAQPDGATLVIQIRGDEFANWTETLDGYTVVSNPRSKAWEYALPVGAQTTVAAADANQAPAVTAQRLAPSGLRPGRDTPPPQSRNLRPEPNAALRAFFIDSLNQPAAKAGASNPWTNNPVSGPRKLLIILVNFSDRTLETTAGNWYDKVLSTTAGNKSVANFYKDNTHGKLSITPVPQTQTADNQGVLTVSIDLNQPNYGKYYTYALETEWLNLATAAAADHVDFDSLDTNNDGVITPDEAVIYFIPAGYEASGTTKTPSVWAHAWGDNGSGVHVAAGSKTLARWAMNGELNGADNQQPMGVICHELGHQLCALPDLYDTSYTNYGFGAFSLMSTGSWGATSGEDNGTTPVSFDAWSRAYCQWDATHLLKLNNRTVSFSPALSDTTLKILAPSLSSTEYFLVENRHATSWDKGLYRWDNSYQGGLLIIHVDNTIGTPGQGTTGKNDINKYGVGEHQGVIAVQADSDCNLLGSYGTGGTGCPGKQTVLYYQGNNAAFTPGSSPNSKLYSGQATGLGLTNISAIGATMTARTISPNAAMVPYQLLLENP